MATFKIDDVEYDTENLDTTQKRVVGLYQKSLQDEGEALNNLEMARAARIELGRKLKELVIDKGKKKWAEVYWLLLSKITVIEYIQGICK